MMMFLIPRNWITRNEIEDEFFTINSYQELILLTSLGLFIIAHLSFVLNIILSFILTLRNNTRNS